MYIHTYICIYIYIYIYTYTHTHTHTHTHMFNIYIQPWQARRLVSSWLSAN